MSLWSDYCSASNVGFGLTRPAHKWTHYLPVYDQYFAPYQNQSLVFWEIGIHEGGSLQLWRRFFPLARIVGLDINPDYAANQSPGTVVRIGDQTDAAFLDSVMAEFGIPDIVLDDGSHQQRDIRMTFEHVYPKIPKNGLYAIEDVHTSYWSDFGGGVDDPNSSVNVAKTHIDLLMADQKGARRQLAPPYLPDIGVPPGPDPDWFTRSTRAIHFHPDIIIYEKGVVFMKDGK